MRFSNRMQSDKLLMMIITEKLAHMHIYIINGATDRDGPVITLQTIQFTWPSIRMV